MGGLFAKPKPKPAAEPRTIVVFGATGAQGGSLVKALKDSSEFNVRAVTRNVESEKAKALAEQGIEVVAADYAYPDTIKAATEGAYGVFAVTNFWDTADKDKEILQGKNIADGCKASSVSHVVFSSLENAKEIIDKECAHFDSKAEIEAYMKDLGLPLTTVRIAFYIENLLTVMKPQKGENENEYILNIPMEGKELDVVPVAETGECIYQIFRNFKKYKGRCVSLSSQRATIAEYAEILTTSLPGKTFKAGEITAQEFGQLEIPAAAEMAAMFELLQSPKIERDIKTTKSLNPSISDLATYVKRNKEAVINAWD